MKPIEKTLKDNTSHPQDEATVIQVERLFSELRSTLIRPLPRWFADV